MKKLLHIIGFVVFTATFNYIQAQSFWAKQIGGSMAEKGAAISVDGGNVFSVGTFSGTCDFDPSASTFTMTSNGNIDAYITKFDGSGNLIWAKRIGGTSADNFSDIVFDAAGNIYLIGDFSTTVDFDPGPGTFNMTVLGNTDTFVLKLDVNGNFVWAKQMGSPWWDRGTSIALDASGNVITTGDFSTTSAGPADFDPGPGTFTFTTGTGGGNTDIFISKLTSAGAFVWAKQIGGVNGDFGNDLQIDNSNNIYVGGYFTGTTDFDPNAGTTNLISLGFEDIYVLKLDNAGNFLWARNMGSNTVDYNKSIAVDGSGNVYSTGSFRGTCDFDPGVGTYTIASAGGDDVFVSKLNSSGNFVWAKSFGAASLDVANAIYTDASGNVFTTGAFRNTVDFDPGAGSYSLTSFGSADVFIQKMDPAGNFLWAGQMGGAQDDYGMGMFVDAAGIVYTTGYFNATSDFDPTAGMLNLTSAGQTDAFVQRMCQVTSQPGAISGPTSLCGNGVQTYSISAVSGATSYSWSLPGSWTGTSTSNNITPFASGSGLITVMALNSCGTSAAQTLSVTINALPTVTAATSSSLICAGQSATLSAGGANLYVWSPSGSGSTIVVSPTVTTTYSVTGLDVNGCQNSAMVTQSVSACAGINSLTSNNSISIYPNPTNGIVKIESTEQDLKIEVINALGQNIISSELKDTSATIDLRNQETGIYFVVLHNENSRIVKKIIKE